MSWVGVGVLLFGLFILDVVFVDYLRLGLTLLRGVELGLCNCV